MPTDTLCCQVSGAGTMYHVACSVKNRVPKHVVQCFIYMWLTHHGGQEVVVVDQGELESTLAQQRRIWGRLRITGSQQSLVERHGSVLE